MKIGTAILGFAAGRFDGRLGCEPISRRGLPTTTMRAERGDAPDDSREGEANENAISRRSLFHAAGMSIAGTASSGPLASFLRAFSSSNSNAPSSRGGLAANAMGLVQFPCPPGELSNTYHLMRNYSILGNVRYAFESIRPEIRQYFVESDVDGRPAWTQSLLESDGILSTNPLFLTNREDALSELGMAQVEEACRGMSSRGVNPSVVKYSLASKCIESANIVATELLVGRIVPEFTFMDQRGVGFWDGKSLDSTEAAVWAMDSAEAGDEGRGGLPPRNDDGTPNETLFEQVTRLRQLMSILETQYSGDDILLIFPDGTSPALLSCLISGIPLNDVHALNYVPGELREGVNMDNTRRLFAERIASSQYLDVLSKGREELTQLRKEYEEHLVEKVGSKKLLMPTPKKSDSLVRRRAFGEDGGPKYSPDIFSAGALGALGGLAMLRVDKKDADDDGGSVTVADGNPVSVLAYVDSTRSSVFEPQAAVPLAPSSVRTAVMDVVDNADLMNTFEDVPVMSKEDRIKAAELAMEEYLSRDDDELFLASLMDIMGED